MTIHRFSLTPFQSEHSIPNVEIQGTLSRHHNRLTISYEIAGEIDNWVIPPLADVPTRQTHLWQTTCLEFFLGPKGQSPYWEFNLSPSTDWNIYKFERYRQGMRPESAIAVLPFEVHRFANIFQLILSVDLSPLVAAEQGLEMGVASVLQSIEGDLTYWALHHPGDEADFHNREGFTIELL
ncbi:MAG: DOMON-like domain-containing protein [Cyanobacteria bacterium P01_F01_bin.4]